MAEVGDDHRQALEALIAEEGVADDVLVGPVVGRLDYREGTQLRPSSWAAVKAWRPGVSALLIRAKAASRSSR